MFGTYRLGLALLVALSHIGVTIAGLNPGVVAVVGFYLISGYMMTGLLRTHYASADRVSGFYVDRALRLFPHYIAIASITFAWFAITGLHTEYLRMWPGAGNVVENVLVVPLNFYMFNHSDRFALVPPAWSLGAEIQFYLVIPVVLLVGIATLRYFALGCSIAIFISATFGWINSDWYGYRLLPGVLYVFLLGSWFYDLHHAGDRRRDALMLCMFVVVGAAMLILILHFRGKLALPYNRETLIGLALGVVAMNVLGQRRRHVLDDAIGALSYGVFLNHFLVQWAFFGGRVAGLGNALAYAGLSLLIAFLMYRGVEHPILAYRRALRKVVPGPYAEDVDAEQRLSALTTDAKKRRQRPSGTA